MSTDSRDQFEQAYSEDNGGLPVEFLKLDRLGESYGTPKVARAWYWWKRALASVVVVLPARHDPHCFDGMREDPEGCALHVDEVIEAIEAAGLRTEQ